MKKAAVIGNPVSHSLSPSIFNFLAKNTGIRLEYEALNISPANLEASFADLKKTHIGLNVTIPYKEVILDLCEEVSKEVKEVGAGNAVQFKESKSYVYNTDIKGILQVFRENNIILNGESVFVIGSGGAARAVVYACGLSNVKAVSIFNRDSQRSDKIKVDMGSLFESMSISTVKDLTSRGIQEKYALIVNTTPLGMEGFDNGVNFFAKIFEAFANPIKWAFDVIYKPEITSFIKEAKRNNCLALGGLGMLVFQALATWAIWFPESQISDDMRGLLTLELKKILE